MKEAIDQLDDLTTADTGMPPPEKATMSLKDFHAGEEPEFEPLHEDEDDFDSMENFETPSNSTYRVKVAIPPEELAKGRASYFGLNGKTITVRRSTENPKYVIATDWRGEERIPERFCTPIDNNDEFDVDGFDVPKSTVSANAGEESAFEPIQEDSGILPDGSGFFTGTVGEDEKKLNENAFSFFGIESYLLPKKE